MSSLMTMSSGSAASSSTVIVGLNGALQKRVILASGSPLVPGDVHRAERVQSGVGGKGQDVAVALHCLEYELNSSTDDVKLAQFVGSGPEGDAVYGMLQELLGSSCMDVTVRSASGMRTCTSIVAGDSTTELVEPSGMIQESELEALFLKLDDLKAKTAALCFMGSMPPGCPDDTYGKIYSSIARSNTICLIDAVTGLEPLLKAIATGKNGPTILKCNASELCRLAGVHKSSTEAGGVRVDELVKAILEFIKKISHVAPNALNAIAVTDGSHPAYFCALPMARDDSFRLFKLPIASLEDASSANSPTLFPIGAGDAVAAGTLAAWKSLVQRDASRGEQCLPDEVCAILCGNESPSARAMMTAFSFGLACGSASCLQEENSFLKLQNVMSLYGKEGRPIFLSRHKLL
jgi:fructose-1-phosphate kinase PfkB-like protein